MTIKISREDLYRAIWSRPVEAVAKDLGISGVALGKICRRYNIPVPGRGYWPRMQAGQSLLQRPLPTEAVRGELIQIKGQPTRTKIVDNNQASADEEESQPQSNAIQRPDVELGPPSMVATNLKKYLESAQTNAEGLIVTKARSQFRVRITPKNTKRVVDIVDRLCRLATTAGLEVQSSEYGIGFKCSGEFVQIEVIEIFAEEPRELTDAESEQLKRWQSKVEAAFRNDPIDPVPKKPDIPKCNYAPTGRLEIRIDKGASEDGLRRRFTDGKFQRVEKTLDKVVTCITACATASISRRKNQAKRAEERRLVEMLYRRSPRQGELQEKGLAYFKRIWQEWQEADEIESFIERFNQHYGRDTIPVLVHEYLDWLSNHADNLRQGRSLEAIAENLRQQLVTGDDAD